MISACDLLRLSGADTTGWPYRRRRAALESMFAARRLSAPWVLCPSTTEAHVVREWLTWTSVGMEGGGQKAGRRLQAVGEGLEKFKVCATGEAVVGAVTGSLAVPRTLPLGRYDDGGRFQYRGRTTTLAQAAGVAVAGLLAAGRRGHPWTGWSFSAGWGSQEKLNITLVEPWNPSWWWKSASPSPATPAAGGGIPHAGTVPAPTDPRRRATG